MSLSCVFGNDCSNLIRENLYFIGCLSFGKFGCFEVIIVLCNGSRMLRNNRIFCVYPVHIVIVCMSCPHTHCVPPLQESASCPTVRARRRTQTMRCADATEHAIAISAKLSVQTLR